MNVQTTTRATRFGSGLVRFVIGVQSIAFLLLLVLQLLTQMLTQGNEAELMRLNRVNYALNELKVALIDQETGQRGYDLTGLRDFLGPYNTGTAAFRRYAGRLLNDASSVPGLETQIETVIGYGERWHNLYGEPQVSRKASGEPVATGALLQGKQELDQFRRTVDRTILWTERRIIADDRRQSGLSDFSLTVALVIIPVTLLLVVLALIRQLNRWIKPITMLTQVVKGYSEGLLEVPATPLNDRTELGELFDGVDSMRRSLLGHIQTVQDRYESLFQNNQAAIVSLTRDGRIREANPAFTELLGYTSVELETLSLYSTVSPAFARLAAAYVSKAANGQKHRFELTLVSKLGDTVQVDVSAIPIEHGAEKGEVYLIMTDITDRRAAEAQIEYMAFHDPLTGLDNRQGIELALQSAIDRSGREADPEFCVLFMDLDGFKLVNDALGHDRGDELLVHVAQRLRRCARPPDRIARIGGDEFMLLCAGSRAVAVELADCILRSMEQSFAIHDIELNITASVGIASFPQDGRDLAELLKRADSAMYSVKESGKNGRQFFDPASDTGTYHKLQMLEDLKNALDHDEFRLLYQPQIEAAHSVIVGAEALLRWEHPTRGLLSPDKFIPLAEESGHIVAIGEWVLREAVSLCKSWHSNGFTHMSVSVNLSPVQFLRADLAESIRCALLDAELAPDFLNLEITERVMLHGERALVTLHRLKSLGVKVSIDDFGTGYSSLGYLRQLPVDELKIDRSFISHMLDNHTDRVIVSTIITLAKSMQLRTVAEGVESGEQFELLRTTDCDNIQGFLFSPPISRERLDSMLAAQPFARDR